MVADMITALMHTIVKHHKMEPLNVDVWKMRMKLLIKEEDFFFFFFLGSFIDQSTHKTVRFFYLDRKSSFSTPFP